MTSIIDYISIFLLLVVLDTPFLQLTKHHFNSIVHSIQGSDIEMNYATAIITYSIMAYSFYHFIIAKKGTLQDAAILGFITYGVFDFTNMSIFKGWDLATSLMDTAWGTLLYTLTYLLYNQLRH